MARVSSASPSKHVLIAETSRTALRALDEDALVALHSRVGRAGDKYVHLHRREVAERVSVACGRGVEDPGVVESGRRSTPSQERRALSRPHRASPDPELGLVRTE